MISASNISKTFKLYKSPADRLKEIILRRSFHRVYHALEDVSFEVAEGETLGIVGQNGAGKSTLLKLLTGVLIPDTGKIHISGRITGLLELGTGFNPEFSGRDNIYLNGTYLGLSRQEIEDRLEKIIKFAELKDFIHEPIKTYSSGMVMRLAFSVAIHADPKAFVVDEALSVGDAYFQQKCMRKIKEFKNNGGSMVFVSHDMNAVKVLCDQAILLDEGNVIEQDTPEKIVNTYNFLIAKRSKGEEIKYQDNKVTSGYGNNRIMIEEVKLLDENNTPSEILVSGKPVKIMIRLAAKETRENITLGIAIRDKFGQDIYGTNSFYLKREIRVQEGQIQTIGYVFDEFNLGPGKYTLSVAVHTDNTHLDECFHWIDKCAVFEVVSSEDTYFQGLIRLKPELHVTNETVKDHD